MFEKSFLLGILFEQIAGSYLYILEPIFIKSLIKISFRVGRSAGFFTNILLIKSMAYGGTKKFFGIVY